MPNTDQSTPTTPADGPITDHQLLTAFLARTPHARCPKCLYTLGVINTDKCPECGLQLRLECGPIPRFSTLWLICFAVLSASLGFAAFALAANFTWEFLNRYRFSLIQTFLEFWPMVVACAILAPGIIMLSKRQQQFDALPRRFRWTIAGAIFATGPIEMFVLVTVVF